MSGAGAAPTRSDTLVLGCHGVLLLLLWRARPVRAGEYGHGDDLQAPGRDHQREAGGVGVGAAEAVAAHGQVVDAGDAGPGDHGARDADGGEHEGDDGGDLNLRVQQDCGYETGEAECGRYDAEGGTATHRGGATRAAEGGVPGEVVRHVAAELAVAPHGEAAVVGCLELRGWRGDEGEGPGNEVDEREAHRASVVRKAGGHPGVRMRWL
ncbi:amastin-like surface protein-like protein [Leishmania tarentolae]|uniref:Amastin-like surface protein-like protein n=1 Tax=Leishmania tarentolae TaxID=5689 RepID=A0A640KI39_LEITA|nr:amastin-like surface protein-like protein [Leishmania tarentolae]